MNYIGIDIGSTCAKTVVLNEKKEIIQEFVQPTGWSSVDTAEEIRQRSPAMLLVLCICFNSQT